MPQTIESAQAWLDAHPNDPLAATVRANLAAAVKARTATAPGAAPSGRSVSTISPVRPPGGPPLLRDPRDPAEVDEDSRHGAPAVAAHYAAKALPTLGSVGGGMIAGAAGVPAGPAAVATGALGAGGGTAVGRYAQIGVDKLLGYPTMDPKSLETAKQVLKEAALVAATQGVVGSTGIASGAMAPKMAEGKMRDLAIGWAKMQGAMSPAKALALKGTQLETVSPAVLDQVIDQSAGGKGAVPAAGAVADRLRAKAHAASEAAPLLTGQPLDQLDDSTLAELLQTSGGGGENTPAAAKALAADFRRRAQVAIDAKKAAAVAPTTPPDMGEAFNAEAAAARLGRQLPTAEAGADAMTNLPAITRAARGADLAPKNQAVIDAIRAKLTGGAEIPAHIQQMVSKLSPTDKAAALKQLGIAATDDESVQKVFDNLRSSVAVAGDASFQAKATGLLDAASTARSSTDQLQSARDAIAKAQATFGDGFTPGDASKMGSQRVALTDQAQLARAARERTLTMTNANNVKGAFGANKDPLFYESQAGMLDSAASAGEKAQAAQARLDALGAEPGADLQYGADARSLDAFVNANTKRGLQRDTEGPVMSAAALAGNRIRHAFAESSPWSASSPVPRAMNAARALEAEAMSRGLPAIDPVLRSQLQAPNNPAVTRAAAQALAAYLYGNQQQPPPVPAQ